MSKRNIVLAVVIMSVLVGAPGSRSGAMGAMTIVETPDATLAANPAALAAFDRAAAEWTALLSNPVTVNLNVGMSTLSDPSDTGFTTPAFVSGTYTTIRNKLVANASGNPALSIVSSLPTTPTFNLPSGFTYSGNIALTRANAKAMGFSVGSGSDATITFNSSFAFDYDNSNGVTPGTIDFQTIAAHEIGHALGFDSAVDVVDGSAPGSILPDPLDMFRFHNVSGQFPTSSADFAAMARDMIPGDDDVLSDAQLDLRLSTGATQGDGRGASHWKDDALTGNYIGIMDPSVVPGAAEAITGGDVRALQLIGWTPIPEPASLGLLGIASLALLGRQRRRLCRGQRNSRGERWRMRDDVSHCFLQ